MGYYEERKAREAGEEACRRGYRSYSNPHDQFATDYDTERCHQEWKAGHRDEERREDERREEEEAEQHRLAQIDEDRRQMQMEEDWRREEDERDWREQEEEEGEGDDDNE